VNVRVAAAGCNRMLFLTLFLEKVPDFSE
jgi:hypothetical protein